MPDDVGQASVLVVAILCAVAIGAVLLGGVAEALGTKEERQRAADLAALAAARAMRDEHPRLFDPGGGVTKAAYLQAGAEAARETARRNGARDVEVSFPDAAELAPVHVRVVVKDGITVAGRKLAREVTAEAMLQPVAAPLAAAPTGDEYRGPLAHRHGKPMRPDVAMAFDRMSAAARADGVGLIVVSGYRSNAEQAALFAARPDPKWVAPPGRSLHRLGTELDIGPPAAYGWLGRNAPRFGFVQRYAWEPWHYGYTRNAKSSQWFERRGRDDGEGGSRLPAFVPARFAPMISKAARRWNVSGALLAAQIWQESRFNPLARSHVGAQGIAQFMPGTAAQYRLRNPLDPEQAIDAQAHLMRDLLRQFAAVPLALAAYNAGPGRVQACGCVPPIPETTGYVAAILGLLGGAGEPAGAGLDVRLVR